MLKLLVHGRVIAVAMLIAPTQPALRAWYLENACPLLDKASTDFCAAMRREAGGKA